MGVNVAATRTRGAVVGGAATVVLFALAPLALLPWPWLRGGLVDVAGDDLLQGLPYLVAGARAFFAGDWLWTPDLFLGQPLLPEPQFALFYLPKQVIALLPPIDGYTIYVYSHYVAAQAFAFVYFRSIGLSTGASVFGGLAWGASGFMVAHRGHTPYIAAGTWAPLYLYFLERASRGMRRRHLVGAGLCFAAVPLAGALQIAVYLGSLTVILQSVLAAARRSWRPLIAAAVALGGGGLIGALQILPSLELASAIDLSARTDFAFAYHESWHPLLLPGLVLHPATASAEYFNRCGAVALCAAAIAIASRRRAPMVRAWLVVGVIGLILMMGRHIPVLPRLLHTLPLVKFFREPGRHAFEVNMALAALAAFGFDLIVARRRRPRGGVAVWFIVAPALVFGAIVGCGWAANRFGVDDVRDYFRGLDRLAIALPVVLIAAWIALATRPVRSRVFAVVVLGATVAAHLGGWRLAAADHVASQWFDRSAELAAAPIAPLPGRAMARVFAPSEAWHLWALPGNVPLMVDGVGGLVGYAAGAPRDAIAVLDLDSHGQPLHPDDMRWSRLPTIFGVTHLVMPRAVCDALDFGLGRDEACAPTGGDVTVARSGAGCQVTLGDRQRRYQLEARFRAAADADLDIELEIRDQLTGDTIEPPPAFDPVEGRRGLMRARWNVDASPQLGYMRAVVSRGEPIGLRSLLTREVTERRTAPLMTISAAQRGDNPALNVERRGGALYFSREQTGVSEAYFAPRRPVTLALTVENAAPPGEVRLSVTTSSRWWRRSVLANRTELFPGATFTWTAALPPDAAVFETRVEAATKTGIVVRLEGFEACRRRAYRRARDLADGLSVYENPRAVAAIYAATDVRHAASLRAARRILRDDPTFTPGRSVVVGPQPKVRAGPRAPAAISAVVRSAQAISFTVDAPRGDAFVVVNDRFHPWWEATVDGVATTIHRVNGLVRGVRVARGKRTVRMRVRTPTSLIVAAGAAGAGAVWLWWLAPLVIRRRRW